MNKVVVATNNQGKLKEFKKILSEVRLDVVSLRDLNINIEIRETGNTFKKNAYIKARTIYDIIKLPTIADDSGLEVKFLNGAPGVFSARYWGKELNDRQRSEKILKLMKDEKYKDRDAKFVCVIVLIIPPKNQEQKETIINSRGECKGKISTEFCGKEGFGYDSIFLVGNETFAQMDPDKKNMISHRGLALKDLKHKLDLRTGLI